MAVTLGLAAVGFGGRMLYVFVFVYISRLGVSTEYEVAGDKIKRVRAYDTCISTVGCSLRPSENLT